MLSLDLDQFNFERIVFETRYPEAYRLWDRAGAIWLRLHDKWPGLTLTTAEPAKTVFRDGDDTEMAVQLKQCRVASLDPKTTLDEFKEKVSMFCKIVFDELQIGTLTRVGTRVIFSKKYLSEDEAAAAVLSTELLQVPSIQIDKGPARRIFPEYAIRFEGKALGATYRIKAEKRITEFKPPFGVPSLKPVQDETDHAIFDVDYFSTTAMTPGQLNASEWLGNALHFVNKSSKEFLERG